MESVMTNTISELVRNRSVELGEITMGTRAPMHEHLMDKLFDAFPSGFSLDDALHLAQNDNVFMEFPFIASNPKRVKLVVLQTLQTLYYYRIVDVVDSETTTYVFSGAAMS